MISLFSMNTPPLFFFFFFFNDTATTEIYTLSLHDALPILSVYLRFLEQAKSPTISSGELARLAGTRSEEHTSELQSLAYLVCRLLLEKKKNEIYDEQRFWQLARQETISRRRSDELPVSDAY